MPTPAVKIIFIGPDGEEQRREADFHMLPRQGERIVFHNDLLEVKQVTHEVGCGWIELKARWLGAYPQND